MKGGCETLGRLQVLMKEAMERGDLVQSRETGLWHMGPYSGKTAAFVLRSAGGPNARQRPSNKEARNAAVGIRLTQADLAGLIRRRPDVIDRLKKRLIMAKES